MKLEKLRSIVARGSVPLLQRRGDAEELIVDIDAEIAKARSAGGSNIDRRVSSLAGGLDEVEMRLAALEASEVALREHCQGNVPMSVFNDLKKRVESMSEDLSSLENTVTRELRALSERVMALEAAPHVEAPPLGEKRREPTDDDDAYKAWRSEPWPDPHVGDGMKFEQTFRAGFRAGRK